MLKYKIGASALAVLLATSTAVSAAVVNIDSITGTWENTVTTGDPATGEGTASIEFGTPLHASASGYDFIATPTPFNATNPFDVGTFIHNNFEITGSSLLSADLQLSVSGTIDGIAFALAPVFSFLHNETTNTSPCDPSGASVCPDVVTIANAQDLSEVVMVNGENFTVTIEGFQVGGDIVSSFLTEENGSNSAVLIASISEPAPVPLPAAAWGLIAGLGALGAMRHRKKKAA